MAQFFGPNSYLNGIKEKFNENEKFEHLEELELFKINSLDQIIGIEEKKYTLQMWLNIGVIFVFSVLQIIGGAILELYSVGIGTHIAAGLISEGISDIFYTFSAAKSGYFNRSDYFIHKIKSIMITIATVAIAGLIAKGVRYSRFGSKLVGNTGNLSKLSGKKLLDAASKEGLHGVKNNVLKKVWCCVGIKISQGVTFGLVNAGVSFLSDKLLKGYCSKIISELFTKTRESIEEKKKQIYKSLKNIYEKFGRQKTEKWLSEINETFNSDKWYDRAYEWLITLANTIVSGISNGINKIKQATGDNDSNYKTALFITVYNAVMKGTAYAKAIYNVKSQTENFIGDIIKKLEEKAKECKNEKNYQENINQKEINDFIDKTTDEWCKTIEMKIDTDVRIKIIEPILCDGANRIIKNLGKTIKKFHEQRKENRLWKKYEHNKSEYENNKKNLTKNDNKENENSESKEILNEITKMYNKNLMIIMAESRSAKLFARIVEQGGPMDMVCIQAMANITGCPIRIKNADGTTFPDLICPEGYNMNNIKDEDCRSIEFYPGDGIDTFGHFSSSENTHENEIINDNNNDNNCFIYGIFKGDKTTTDANEVRKLLAKEIENSPLIKDMITDGNHHYYISQLGFGGQLPINVMKLKMMKLSENFENALIGLVGVHGNGSYGITSLSKSNVRESEHLIPYAVMKRWSKVMCVRDIIETEHFNRNENEKECLFKDLMKPESVIPTEKLNKFMISPKQMLAICMIYDAHRDPECNWSSFKTNGSEKWKEVYEHIDKYKSVDDNQNDLVMEKCICQYSHLVDNPKIY
ncbi:unnamed protein product [Didymodactylos carnosus]|uniref:Uncharacterized protein n=1 Tax=Didymodactylos carnosus TaxID=1234261 RepID=A0A813Z096_9BILA|nr:unnamed protein product [Didymodactylos carnosus]CAF3675467.1 unnamed protein product [Didymodactylos carnosus]